MYLLLVKPSPRFNFSLKFVMQTSDAWRAIKPSEDRHQAIGASSDGLEEGEEAARGEAIVDRADSGYHYSNGIKTKNEVIGGSDGASWVIFSYHNETATVLARGQIDFPGKHIRWRSNYTGALGPGGRRPDS